MLVSSADFINSPALYLKRVEVETVLIIKDGHTIAVLSKPSDTPVSDSLIGILKDSGIKDKTDVKALRTGL